MRVPLLSIVLLIPAASQAVQQSHSAAVPSQATRPRPTPLDLDATEAIGGLRVPMQNRYSREAWGLSEAAWARYRLLMQGIRGSTSQGNISPLEVLGIHAETEQERRDYARRYARMMKEDTDRVLAFARVYAEESAKLSAGLPILDKALLQLTATQPEEPVRSDDRLLLFTRTQPCAVCEQYLTTAIEASSRSSAQLDIYFHDAGSDKSIRNWVSQHALDPARIRGQTITFNHHRGELTRLAGGTAVIPNLMRLRGNAAVPIQPNQLSE